MTIALSEALVLLQEAIIRNMWTAENDEALNPRCYKDIPELPFVLFKELLYSIPISPPFPNILFSSCPSRGSSSLK